MMTSFFRRVRFGCVARVVCLVLLLLMAVSPARAQITTNTALPVGKGVNRTFPWMELRLLVPFNCAAALSAEAKLDNEARRKRVVIVEEIVFI